MGRKIYEKYSTQQKLRRRYFSRFLRKLTNSSCVLKIALNCFNFLARLCQEQGYKTNTHVKCHSEGNMLPLSTGCLGLA